LGNVQKGEENGLRAVVVIPLYNIFLYRKLQLEGILTPAREWERLIFIFVSKDALAAPCWKGAKDDRQQKENRVKN
jgi:hypothetical protein